MVKAYKSLPSYQDRQTLIKDWAPGQASKNIGKEASKRLHDLFDLLHYPGLDENAEKAA